MSGARANADKPLRDRAAILRDLTVATLIRYGTPAGAYVEAFRTEGIPDGDMPRITVSTKEDFQGTGFAPPAFDVTVNLTISAFSERASRVEAIAELDALLAQIREALLGDPDWVRAVTRITDLEVVRHWDNRAERLIAAGHTRIAATWRELYPPRVPDVLTGIDTTVRLPGGAIAATVETDFPPTAPTEEP